MLLGKTLTLANRVAYLLSEGIPPSKILILTFTNRATYEFRERIKKIVGPSLSQYLKIMTVHAYCQDLLYRHGDIIGLSESPTVATKLDQEYIYAVGFY